MTNKYRFHVLGLVHLPTSKVYSSCAFTQKNIKMCKMLISLGHEVYFYGAKSTEGKFDLEQYINSPRFHFVLTHEVKDIARDYGTGDNRYELGYDWHNGDYKHDFSGPKKASTMQFYSKCITEINKIKRPDDFLLCTQGDYHKPIADGVGLFLTCESGIGYRGSVKEWFRCFESSYIQNFTYGSEAPFASLNGSYYDRVIPNYFDPEDIEYSDKKGDYYLFIGRIIKRKGILSAIKACEALGKKLIIVGQGGVVEADGSIHDVAPTEFSYPAATWEYRGFADFATRKGLFAHAIATFTPTEYLECFGGTHIESMLSGTPAITTDFGVFPATVKNGLNGYRCNTLDDFVKAAQNCTKLDPQAVRNSAERYLMDNVRWDYERWFDDLMCVYESTLPEGKKGWNRVRTKDPKWRKAIKW